MSSRSRSVVIGGMVVMAGLIVAVVHGAPDKPAASSGGATRVAVVDIVTVFNQFEQTKVLKEKFAARDKVLEQEADKRSKETKSEHDALEAMAPDSAEFFKQNQKVKRMVFENEVWRQVEQDNMAENHRRWVLRTYQAVTAEVEKVAKARGIDIVLTREKFNEDIGDSQALMTQILSIKVLYASKDASVDLSEEVLNNLNANFAKSGGAATIKFGE